MPGRYVKKPVVVEAMQLTVGNQLEVFNWVSQGNRGCILNPGELPSLEIMTLEGNMIASHGDFVIKGIRGEFYPCKPDIFHACYDRVGGEVDE